MDLKACPFCGSKAVLHRHKDNHKPFAAICQNPDAECNARIPYCDSAEQSTEQWNKRWDSLNEEHNENY